MNILNNKLSVSLALVLIVLCGCSEKAVDTHSVRSDTDEIIFNIGDQNSDNSTDSQNEHSSESDIYSEMISSMTVEEKVGQLFFIRPEQLIDDSYVDDESIVGEDGEGATYVSDNFIEMYSEYPVGGFVLFAKNIEYPEQLISFTNDLKSIGKIDTLIAVDEEGGIVTRLAGNENFNLPYIGTMESIGLTGDVTNAYDAGDAIGEYLSDYGIMWDLAPVADINTNPDNRVIGNRSFGSDPQLAAKMVRSYIDGLHDHGVKSTLKHFPGHGDTTDDTHTGNVYVEKTWDELLQAELIPFAENLDVTDAVMTAHITLPNVTDDDLPCSLSYVMITEKLRGELGFEGVVICDSLAMGGVTDRYTSGEAAVMAFEAGCDVLLTPQNFYEAYRGVLDAVNSGEITQERLDESVRRILILKEPLIKEVKQ